MRYSIGKIISLHLSPHRDSGRGVDDGKADHCEADRKALPQSQEGDCRGVALQRAPARADVGV
jgi:hypothetical protein